MVLVLYEYIYLHTQIFPAVFPSTEAGIYHTLDGTEVAEHRFSELEVGNPPNIVWAPWTLTVDPGWRGRNIFWAGR